MDKKESEGKMTRKIPYGYENTYKPGRYDNSKEEAKISAESTRKYLGINARIHELETNKFIVIREETN